MQTRWWRWGYSACGIITLWITMFACNFISSSSFSPRQVSYWSNFDVPFTCLQLFYFLSFILCWTGVSLFIYISFSMPLPFFLCFPVYSDLFLTLIMFSFRSVSLKGSLLMSCYVYLEFCQLKSHWLSTPPCVRTSVLWFYRSVRKLLNIVTTSFFRAR